MMNTTESEQFIDDVVGWLWTRPLPPDILYYVKHLPADGLALLDAVTERAASSLQGTKDAFLRRTLPGLVESANDTVQLGYILQLCAYTTASVVASIQESFPRVQNKSHDGELYRWSVDYVSVWDAVFLFGACADYLRLRPYLVSFVSLKLSGERLIAAQEFFEQRLLADTKANEVMVASSTEERRLELDFLRSIKFLPEEYIAHILDLRNASEKILLYRDLFQVVSILSAFGMENAAQDPQEVYAFLWRRLKDRLEVEFLGDLNAQWRADHEEKKLKDFYAWLTNEWTLEGLFSGSVQNNMLAYLAQYNINGKKRFLKYLEAFIRQSPVAQYLLEPLEPKNVLGRIEMAVSSGLENEVNSELLQEIYPEREEGARQLMAVVCSIYKAIKTTTHT